MISNNGIGEQINAALEKQHPNAVPKEVMEEIARLASGDGVNGIRDLRQRVSALIFELRQNIFKLEYRSPILPPQSNIGEMFANAILALRALEDADARLGRVIIACTGNSVGL